MLNIGKSALKTRKHKSGAFKALPSLKKKDSNIRIKEICSLICGREKMPITSTDLQVNFDERCNDFIEFLQVIFKKIEKQLIHGGQRKKKIRIPKSRRSALTPLQDLQVCSSSMTWYQRCKLKSDLIKASPLL